jgi:hypothetical protein
MNIEDVIQKIISLPKVFNDLSDVSIFELIKETGYFQMHDQILEQNIREELNRHPEYVKEWLNYSEDKRSDSGYYFKQDDRDNYVVGYYDKKNRKQPKRIYTNQIEACASFVKNEIEDIRIRAL